ncbi:MAG: hypothetical protein K9H49_19960 [Bacteroidales bacterium]|nr:hypothetical protein [Bacteroidales bacterium]MCF8391160.1 hypothetical protein [Bacteroidales bacterium]
MEVIIYDSEGKVIAEKKQEASTEASSFHYKLLLSDTENEIEFVKLQKIKDS